MIKIGNNSIWTPDTTQVGHAVFDADKAIRDLIFGHGEKGVLLKAKPSTVFQNPEGTIAGVLSATAGMLLDLSGNNNHLIQSNSGSQMRLQVDSKGKHYLLTDGIDDFMRSKNEINMTHTNSITTVCKIRMTNNTKLGYPWAFGDYASSVQAGTLHVRAPQAVNTLVAGMISKGANAQASSTATLASMEANAILSTVSNTEISPVKLYANGVLGWSNLVEQGGGSYGNHILYVGRISGARDAFAGRIYGLCIVDRNLTDAERLAVEQWMDA